MRREVFIVGLAGFNTRDSLHVVRDRNAPITQLLKHGVVAVGQITLNHTHRVSSEGQRPSRGDP